MEKTDFDLWDRISGAQQVDLLSFFFQLLWKKRNASKDSAHELINVFVPDTVVFHFSRPLAWFFTSVQDGTIRRKNRSNLISNEVVRSFVRKGKSVSGCAAQFTCTDATREEGFNQIFDTAPAMAPRIAGSFTGLAQIFIDPKGENVSNSDIVAHWTPNVFFVERRMNKNALADERVPLQDRCETHETSAFVTAAALVSSHSVKKIETVCTAIAEHIDVVFQPYRIVGMSVHFRIAEDDVPVVLFCSSLRVLSAEHGRSVTLTLGGKTETPVKLPGSPSPARSSASHQQQQPQRTVPGRGDEDDEDDPLSAPLQALVDRRRSGAASQGVCLEHCALCKRRLPKPTQITPNRRSVSSSLSSYSSSSPSSSPGGGSIERRRKPDGRRSTSTSPHPHTAYDENDGEVSPGIKKRGSPTSQKKQKKYLEIAVKHVLFPLAVLSFYSSHPNGTLFREYGWEDGDEVPAHVRLIFPEVSSWEYSSLHTQSEWQNTLVRLCLSCADGIQYLTASIQTDAETGAITTPFGKHPMPLFAEFVDSTVQNNSTRSPQQTQPQPADSATSGGGGGNVERVLMFDNREVLKVGTSERRTHLKRGILSRDEDGTTNVKKDSVSLPPLKPSPSPTKTDGRE